MEETKKHAPRMVVEEVGSEAKSADLPEPTPEKILPQETKVEEPVETEPIETVTETPKSKSFNLLWVLIPGLLLLGLLMGGIFAYYNGINKINKSAPAPTETPTETVTPTPSPTAVKSDLTKYAITILNGSGIAGEAGKVKTLLETAGFKVSSTANAKTYDYDKTVISVKDGIEADFIQALVTALGKTYQVDDPTTVSTQTSPVIVTVGNLKAK